MSRTTYTAHTPEARPHGAIGIFWPHTVTFKAAPGLTGKVLERAAWAAFEAQGLEVRLMPQAQEVAP
jgi:hypothetical protein